MSEEAIQDTGSQEIASEATPVSFLDSLPEDLRNEPSLRTFTDPGSLAKSYVNAQRMIGADKIALPSKSATPDEWREVYAKLGAPSDPKEYSLEMPENILQEAEFENFRAALHEAGLNNMQAQRMAEFLENSVGSARENFQNSAEEARYQSEQELRQEFGQAFEQRLEMAKLAATNLLGGTDVFDEIQLSDGRMLGDHPDIIRMFSNLASAIGEDNLAGETAELVMTPEEASRQIAEMTRRDGPYWDKMHPEHDTYVAEVLRLREYM